LLVLVRWRFLIAVFAVIFGFVIVTGYKVGRRQALMMKSAADAASENPGSTPAGQTAPPVPGEAGLRSPLPPGG